MNSIRKKEPLEENRCIKLLSLKSTHQIKLLFFVIHYKTYIYETFLFQYSFLNFQDNQDCLKQHLHILQFKKIPKY